MGAPAEHKGRLKWAFALTSTVMVAEFIGGLLTGSLSLLSDAAGIGLFILPRTGKLVRESIHVLLEGTPPEVNTGEVAEAIRSVPSVREVHDLQVWTVRSGFPSLSAHVIAAPGKDHGEILSNLRGLLRERFGIRHSTLQLEAFSEDGAACETMDTCHRE